jgi:hypothetical protein
MSFSTLKKNLFMCCELQEIWHTISFSHIDEVPVKTLVAYVASGGSLRIGYAFRTRSTLAVYYDEELSSGKRPLKRSFPPVCATFLVFNGITTKKTESELTNIDLDLEWLTQNVIEKIHSGLGSQRSAWGKTFDQIIDSLHELPIEKLSKVLNYIHSE